MRHEHLPLRFWIFALIVVAVTSSVVLTVTGAWAQEQTGSTGGTSGTTGTGGTGGTGGTIPDLPIPATETPIPVIPTLTPTPVSATPTPDPLRGVYLRLDQIAFHQLQDRLAVEERLNSIEDMVSSAAAERAELQAVLDALNSIDMTAWQGSWDEFLDNQREKHESEKALIETAIDTVDGYQFTLDQMQRELTDLLTAMLIPPTAAPPTPVPPGAPQPTPVPTTAPRGGGNTIIQQCYVPGCFGP